MKMILKCLYKRIPNLLQGAPLTFTEAMVSTSFVVLYFDMLIFSELIEQHLEHLKIFFDRLVQSGLHIDETKYQICLMEVNFLGFAAGECGTK